MARAISSPLMAGMTKGEINTLVFKYIGVEGGYLRGFSYSEHERFYVEFCDLPPTTLPARTCRWRHSSGRSPTASRATSWERRSQRPRRTRCSGRSQTPRRCSSRAVR